MSLSVDLTPPRSTISAEALLEVAENPEKFRKMLEDIKAAEAKHDATLALVGPAEQILDMREQANKHFQAAETAKGAAQELLNKARNDAALIVDAAQTKAGQLVHAAEVEAKVTRANAQRVDNETVARQAKVTERETAVSAREAAIKAREDAADIAHAQAVATKKTYEDHHAKLKAALASVG